MKFSLSSKQQKGKIHKPGIINIQRYWLALLSFFVFALTLELLYFSWFFIRTSRIIDAPVLPSVETNAKKIEAMQKKIETVEKAIEERTGKSEGNTDITQ